MNEIVRKISSNDNAESITKSKQLNQQGKFENIHVLGTKFEKSFRCKLSENDIR